MWYPWGYQITGDMVRWCRGIFYPPDFLFGWIEYSIRPDNVFLGYFIRGQDILSPKASSYMRLQSSCPVGCVALYPTAIDFWKSKDAWHCAMKRYSPYSDFSQLQGLMV